MRLSITFLILNLFILTSSSFAKASDAKTIIQGRIIEQGLDTPIDYVTISLFNANDSTLVTGTISDEKGEFQLTKMDYGHYYLVFDFIGYGAKVINNISLTKEQPKIDLETVEMAPEANVLQEISVTATKSAVSLDVDKQVVNVASNLSAKGGTAIDAIRTAPAVSVDGEGNVKVRGSSQFTVLINGKPTALSAEEVLKQTPADIIDKIEIVTSPSVKYTAEGTAGIVNIILKKGIKQGFNGLFDLTAGARQKYASNASVNFNREKFNVSAGFEWRDFTKTALNNYYRNLYQKDTTHTATMFQDRTIRQSNLGFRLNANYMPNEQTDIAYSLNTGYQQLDGDIIAENSGRTVPASTELFRKNSYYIKQRPTFFTNNLNFSQSLQNKQSISVNAYYSFIDYELYTSQVLALTDADHRIIDNEPYQQQILNDNYSHQTRIDADYTVSIHETSKLETGLSFQSYSRFLDITFDQFDYNANEWKHNSLYTNKYGFQEDIYGAYANYNTEFLGITASLGLRLEYMDRELKQQTSEESYAYDKLNYFPGFSLSKSINEKQSVRLSLTNRINRPDEYMMNPFPEFEDDYFYSEGNPNLVPELSRALEFNYQQIGEKTVFSSSLYYRNTQDKIVQKLTIGDQDKIHTIFHNDAMDQSTGVELMWKFDVQNWWNLNATTNFYHYSIKGNIDEDPFAESNFTYNAQLVNSITLGKSSSFQIIGYYNSETVRAQGTLGAFYFVDVAYKQQFLNDKLSLNFQVKDVFQSANYELKTATGNMDLRGEFINESPIFLMTVSYQLSNYKKLTKDVQTDFDM
jgi:hypothetical protein